MKDMLLIIGASGHGKVVADIAIKMNKWQRIAFFDDDESIKECMGYDVVGTSDDIDKYADEADFFVAIGNNAIREKVFDKLEFTGVSVPVLIHPSAVIGEDVSIDIGTVVMAGVVINSSTHIGKGGIINSGAIVEHDNIINDYVHISPGVVLSGTVSVGRCSWVGAGSIVSNNISICKDSIIGAGSVVISDILEQGTYVGVPVRRVENVKDINSGK